MSDTNATHDLYRERFGAGSDDLPGAALPWIADLRGRGMDALSATGLPTLKWEDWKYTNLNLLRQALDAAAEPPASAVVDAIPARLAADAAHRLVLVDGQVCPELSSPHPLPDGVSLRPLSAALADPDAGLQDALAALDDLATL